MQQLQYLHCWAPARQAVCQSSCRRCIFLRLFSQNVYTFLHAAAQLCMHAYVCSEVPFSENAFAIYRKLVLHRQNVFSNLCCGEAHPSGGFLSANGVKHSRTTRTHTHTHTYTQQQPIVSWQEITLTFYLLSRDVKKEGLNLETWTLSFHIDLEPQVHKIAFTFSIGAEFCVFNWSKHHRFMCLGSGIITRK